MKLDDQLWTYLDSDGGIKFDVRQYENLLSISRGAPAEATHWKTTLRPPSWEDGRCLMRSDVEYTGDEFTLSFGGGWMPLIPIACPKCKHKMEFPKVGTGRTVELECECGFKMRFEGAPLDDESWYDGVVTNQDS